MEVTLTADQFQFLMQTIVSCVVGIGCAVCAFQGFRAGNAFQ